MSHSPDCACEVCSTYKPKHSPHFSTNAACCECSKCRKKKLVKEKYQQIIAPIEVEPKIGPLPPPAFPNVKKEWNPLEYARQEGWDGELGLIGWFATQERNIVLDWEELISDLSQQTILTDVDRMWLAYAKASLKEAQANLTAHEKDVAERVHTMEVRRERFHQWRRTRSDEAWARVASQFNNDLLKPGSETDQFMALLRAEYRTQQQVKNQARRDSLGDKAFRRGSKGGKKKGAYKGNAFNQRG